MEATDTGPFQCGDLPYDFLNFYAESAKFGKWDHAAGPSGLGMHD